MIANIRPCSPKLIDGDDRNGPLSPEGNVQHINQDHEPHDQR